jgi:hypothetical protein
MPKKGKRTHRKCRRCDQPVVEKWTNGLFKGYLQHCPTHLNWHHKPGPSHPNARKQGRRVNEEGYVQLLDPRRETAKKKGSNYILEHRLVMETTLGRRLKRTEVIHHLNGIRDDNRPENLVLLGPNDEHESRTLIKALQRRITELENQIRALV